MGSGCHKSQVKQTGLFRAVGTPLHTNLVVRLIPITLRDASSGTMAGRPRPIQQSASAVGPQLLERSPNPAGRSSSAFTTQQKPKLPSCGSRDDAHQSLLRVESSQASPSSPRH
jgi:hypothetical protein